jgi:hypothetical protein
MGLSSSSDSATKAQKHQSDKPDGSGLQPSNAESASVDCMSKNASPSMMNDDAAPSTSSGTQKQDPQSSESSDQGEGIGMPALERYTEEQDAVVGTTFSDAASLPSSSRKRKAMNEDVAQCKKRLKVALKAKEEQGDGEFQEVEELQILWSHPAGYECEGKRIDVEACVATVIKSQATGLRYIVVPKGGQILPKADMDKTVLDARAMPHC